MERLEASALLELDQVSRHFRIRRGLRSRVLPAVDRVSLTLPSNRHTIVAIVGESGSGKTTLARMILGLISPTGGKISFLGRDITRLSGWEKRGWFRRKVQPVFQDPFATFNPLRRVESYLYDTARNFRGTDPAPIHEIVDHELNAVGLSLNEVAGRYPMELSGGQLQRISIARALIARPLLLVADEPVSMLDASLRMSIVNLLKQLTERLSVIYITHDLATSYYLADQVAVMLRGWVVEYGPVDKVLGEPLHPYTQLLRDAVLEPDPRQRSREPMAIASFEQEEYFETGCRFARRCPRAMVLCRTVEPKDWVVDGRVVKCHLYGGSHSVEPVEAVRAKH